MATAVYRLFNDDGDLLYIGIANRPDERLSHHRGLKRWWPQVARTQIEWHESRADAKLAEAAAILGEGPLYNILVPGANGKWRPRKDVPRIALTCPTSPWYLVVVKGTPT